MALIVRRAEPQDVPALAEIENECFTDPWSPDALYRQLAADYAASFVAVQDGETVGEALLSCFPPESEVYRVATRKSARRTGVGEALLSYALAEVEAEGVEVEFLDVREGNLPAQSLYRKLGFGEYGRRKDYYRLPKEDALLMLRKKED